MFSRWRARSAGKKETAQRDPVCGMRVNPTRARSAMLVVEHEAEAYFFCNDGCKQAFEVSPDRYVKR